MVQYTASIATPTMPNAQPARLPLLWMSRTLKGSFQEKERSAEFVWPRVSKENAAAPSTATAATTKQDFVLLAEQV